jgi:LPXTG-motif cell wall-anchored protein
LSAVLVILLLALGFQGVVSAENHGEPPIMELEQQFENLIYQETTENGQLKNYDSMDKLEQDLKGIMVWPLADHYLDTFFYEENGNVYLVSRDGPISFMSDQEYHLEKINDKHYKLTQSGNNELSGDYMLTIDYKYEAGKWVFGERMDNAQADNGGQMPDTATSLPVMIVVGGMLMLIGALFMMRRKHVNA